MKVYELRNTLDTGYGPSVPYSQAYWDTYKFHADNDSHAKAQVETLQAIHDKAYVSLGVSEDSESYMNAPCYVNHIYLDGVPLHV